MMGILQDLKEIINFEPRRNTTAFCQQRRLVSTYWPIVCSTRTELRTGLLLHDQFPVRKTNWKYMYM